MENEILPTDFDDNTPAALANEAAWTIAFELENFTNCLNANTEDQFSHLWDTNEKAAIRTRLERAEMAFAQLKEKLERPRMSMAH